MRAKLYILEGRDRGKSYPLENNRIYTLGRSGQNDIQLGDPSVSTYHLKIQRKAEKYCVTDLGSKNGTFICGKEIPPLTELEVEVGVPVVIGMSVLGVGEACVTHLEPFLESIGVCSKMREADEPSKAKRLAAVNRNLKFVYDVIDVLTSSREIDEVAKKIVDHIFILLKRIDRCAILLTDAQGGISKVIYRSRRAAENLETAYNRKVVEHVLLVNKPVLISDSHKAEDDEDEMAGTLKLMRIRSVMCVPMCSCLQTIGVMYVDSLERPHGFRKSDVSLLADVCGRVALAMECISLQSCLESP